MSSPSRLGYMREIPYPSVAVPAPAAVPLSLAAFARLVGRSHVSIWRWRKAGWLDVVNIAGRPFVTPQALADFNRRAASGEFAKALPKPPGREGRTNGLAGSVS